jgi:hypothetical protein
MRLLMAAPGPIDGVREIAAVQTLAVKRRRECRRWEFAEQAKLAAMLTEFLNPETTFWSGLENRPTSRFSGFLQKKRGIKAGITDFVVLHFVKREKRTIPIFLELKSKAGNVTRAQRQIRVELVKVGCSWWMCRTARSALTALHIENVPFRRRWKKPRLAKWEGPFNGTELRLPQHPQVAAERRAAQQRYRQSQRARKAAKLAAERGDVAGADNAA